MDSISLYQDAARDLINKDENGYMSYEMFNRMLQIASNKTLDWITGDSTGQTLPLSYSTQKAKDFIAFLITPYKAPIEAGIITRPADYYTYENLSILSLSKTGCEDDDSNCDSDTPTAEIIETPVEVLDGQQFGTRCKTYIKGLKPSPQKPIAKFIGKTIEFMPKELGSCKLEYIRYPIAGRIETTIDPVYYDVVADAATSVDTEWDEWARSILLYFIGDAFANHTREQALKQFNTATGKKP